MRDEKIKSIETIYNGVEHPVILCGENFKILWFNPASKNVYPGCVTGQSLGELLTDIDIETVTIKLKFQNRITQISSLYFDTPVIADFLKIDTENIENVENEELILVMLNNKSTAGFTELENMIDVFSQQFRTQFNAVFNNLSMMAYEMESREMYEELDLLLKINNTSYGMLRAVINFTEYRRIKSGLIEFNKKIKNMREYLTSFLAEAQKKLAGSDKNTPLKIILPAETENVFCQIDVEKYELAVLNVLHNSVLFTRPDNEISLQGKVSGNYFDLIIKDEGVGIDSRYMDKIFEPYFSYNPNDENSAGLGLGLPLAKSIFELHDGSCWVNSQPNEGTSFILRLPLADMNSLEATTDVRDSGNDKKMYAIGKFSPLNIQLGNLCNTSI